MTISVIIPAYNEEAFIGKTIEYLRHAINQQIDRSITWEIIVCNNNSSDQTAKIASEAGAIVVFEPVNQISRARNCGAKVAKGEWLIFLDADSFPTPELLNDVLNLIKIKKHIGCGSTITVKEGTLFNKLRMERINPIFRLLNLCGGAFIVCKKEAFDSIGGFSTDLFAYEEVDFLIRLKKYSRKTRKKFTILYKHPVATSGRKGEFTFSAMSRLFVSNFAAVVLFGLYYILPGRWVRKVGRRFLGYWYGR